MNSQHKTLKKKHKKGVNYTCRTHMRIKCRDKSPFLNLNKFMRSDICETSDELE